MTLDCIKISLSSAGYCYSTVLGRATMENWLEMASPFHLQFLPLKKRRTMNLLGGEIDSILAELPVHRKLARLTA